jgi:hypothetical protein
MKVTKKTESSAGRMSKEKEGEAPRMEELTFKSILMLLQLS